MTKCQDKKYCSIFDPTPRCVFSEDEEMLFAGIKHYGILNTCKALVALCKLRNTYNEPNETNDAYLFCLALHNLYKFSGINEEEVIKRIFKFNDEFKKPLPEKEILNYLNSNEIWYRFSSNKLINLLNITECEQSAIKLVPKVTSEDGPSYDMFKKAVKREIRIEHVGRVIAYHMIGVNNSHIALITGYTRQTVIKYVHKYQKGLLEPEYLDMANRYVDYWENTNQKM